MATGDIDQWTDLGLRRLFDPRSIEHLPIDEQLLYYKQRDLEKTKVFNIAAKIWGAPLGRRRIIVAGGSGRNKSRCFRADFAKQDGGVIAANLDVDDEIGDEQNSNKFRRSKHLDEKRAVSGPAISSRDQKPAVPSSAPGPEPGPSGGEDNYHSWLTSRMRMRSDLESMGDIQKWFANKPNKSGLEARVLQRIVEASGKEPEKPPSNERDSEMDSPTQSEPPDIQQPAPVGLVILDKWIRDNHSRLLELFAEMDKDKDWLVTLEDFKHIVETAGIPMSDSELQDLIMALDSDADNHIKYQDIVRGHRNYRAEERANQQQSQQEDKKMEPDSAKEAEGAGARKPPQYVSRFNLTNKSKVVKKKKMKILKDKYPNEAVFLAEENSPHLVKSDIMTNSRHRDGNRKGLRTKTVREVSAVAKTTTDKEASPVATVPGSMATTPSSRERAKVAGERSAVTFKSGAKFDEGHEVISRPSTGDSLTVPTVDLSEKINVDDEILLESSRRHRFQKRVDRSGLEVESLMIQAGEPGVDQHCSYSTMCGENRDSINTFRLQSLKEYLRIIELCEKNNIVMDVKLLQRALLYPGDKPVSVLKKNLHQPGAEPFPSGVVPFVKGAHLRPPHAGETTTSRSAVSSSMATMATTFRSRAGSQVGASPGLDGGRDLPAPLRYPAEDDDDSDSSLNTDDYKLKSPPQSQPNNPLFLYPKKLRPSMKARTVRLTTGPARIGPKTDCWMTFSEYLALSRDVKKKKPYYRGASDVDSCWPGHLLDKLRLCMPPYDNTGPSADREQSIFANTKQPLPSIAGKYNNVKFYPESDAGYVKYGDITQNKIYQL